MTAAIILAGNHLGHRGGLDWVAPRLVWPIGNVPLVHWLLRWLQAAEIDWVAICSSTQAGVIRQQVEQLAGVGGNVHYVIDQVPRGPAGCAHDAAALVAAEDYVIIEGALLSDIDLGQVLQVHRRRGATTTVVADSSGSDATPDACTPAGIFVFERDALGLVPATGYQDIKEMLLPRLYAAGETVISYPARRAPLRVHTLDSYLAAQAWAIERGGNVLDLRSDFTVAGSICVHHTAEIAATVRLVGPVLVAPRVRVEEEVIIIGPATVGARCTIGKRSVLGRCVLWDDCHVRDDVHLEDCVLTTGTRVEDGQTGLREVLRGRTRWHVGSSEPHELAL